MMQAYLVCPECSHAKDKSREKCISTKPKKGVLQDGTKKNDMSEVLCTKKEK